MECGCTCTAAVLRGHTLCIGHVGDSQAVLGSRVGSSGYSLRVLTQKHNCLNAAEVERVLSHCQAAGRLQAVDFHKVGDPCW